MLSCRGMKEAYLSEFDQPSPSDSYTVLPRNEAYLQGLHFLNLCNLSIGYYDFNMDQGIMFFPLRLA